MKSIFDNVSYDCSKTVTKTYSTSFSLATKMLSKSIRQDIYNIYGFVRFADEIVDSFHDYNKEILFNKFEYDLELAIKNNISLNPILNSFQYTFHRYNIDKVQTFTYGSAFSTATFNSRDDTKPGAADNEMYTANIGYNYTFSDINLIGSKLLYTRKKAKDDYNSYRGPGINFNYTRLLPFGTLKIDKTFQTNTYNARDVFINTMTDREDDLYTSAIQLTGRINQLVPFLNKIDPKGQFF